MIIEPAYDPEISRWGEAVYDAGKLLLHYARGHVRALLPILAEEEIDAGELVD